MAENRQGDNKPCGPPSCDPAHATDSERPVSPRTDVDTPQQAVFSVPTVMGTCLKPNTRLGRFEIRELLGRGGMGEVWKAYDAARAGYVVIKVLPPEFQHNPAEVARLRASFQRVSLLQHQHICPVYDLAEAPECGLFLVMKHVAGETLAVYRWKYARANGSFSAAEAVRVLQPIAAALDYAHAQGIVHRDIKPQNVLVQQDGANPQLVDFGLAAEIRESTSRVSRVRNDNSGTYPYMAPEQWRGRRQDGRADQYALGVVAYELLAGEVPFAVADTEVLRLCVLNETPPLIAGQSAQVNATLRKALAKSPEDRFESCTAMVAALTAGEPGTSGTRSTSAVAAASNAQRGESRLVPSATNPETIAASTAPAREQRGQWLKAGLMAAVVVSGLILWAYVRPEVKRSPLTDSAPPGNAGEGASVPPANDHSALGGSGQGPLGQPPPGPSEVEPFVNGSSAGEDRLKDNIPMRRVPPRSLQPSPAKAGGGHSPADPKKETASLTTSSGQNAADATIDEPTVSEPPSPSGGLREIIEARLALLEAESLTSSRNDKAKQMGAAELAPDLWRPALDAQQEARDLSHRATALWQRHPQLKGLTQAEMEGVLQGKSPPSCDWPADAEADADQMVSDHRLAADAFTRAASQFEEAGKQAGAERAHLEDRLAELKAEFAKIDALLPSDARRHPPRTPAAGEIEQTTRIGVLRAQIQAYEEALRAVPQQIAVAGCYEEVCDHLWPLLGTPDARIEELVTVVTPQAPRSWLKEAQRLVTEDSDAAGQVVGWLVLANTRRAWSDTAGCDEAILSAERAAKKIADPFEGSKALLSVLVARQRLGRYHGMESLAALLTTRLDTIPSVTRGRPVPEKYHPAKFKMGLFAQLAGVCARSATRSQAAPALLRYQDIALSRIESISAGLGTEGQRCLVRLYRMAASLECGSYAEAAAESQPQNRPYFKDHFAEAEWYGALVHAMLASGAARRGDRPEYDRQRLAAEGMLATGKGRSSDVLDQARLALIEAAVAAGDAEQARWKVTAISSASAKAAAKHVIGIASAREGDLDVAGQLLYELVNQPKAAELAYELGRARGNAGERVIDVHRWLQTLPAGAHRGAAMAGVAEAFSRAAPAPK